MATVYRFASRVPLIKFFFLLALKCIFFVGLFWLAFTNLHVSIGERFTPQQQPADVPSSVRSIAKEDSTSRSLASNVKAIVDGDAAPRQISKRTNATDTASPKVIFYHIYLPANNIETALKIVQEQLAQLGTGQGVTLFYSTIGDSTTLTSQQMQEWCQHYNLANCQQLGHYDSGMEEVTLQSVYSYCQTQQEHSQRVGYLHNKGSYHKGRPINGIWRRLLTETVARDDCWGHNHEDQCNACGLYFTTDWGLYFAGNVWTADCQYIRRLLPPLRYESHARAAYQEALLREKLGQLEMKLYSVPPLYHAGIGRYAAEWWSASGPSLKPCDYSNSIPLHGAGDRSTQFLTWLESHQDDADASSLLTQFTPQAPGWSYKVNSLDMPPMGPTREYFLLAGKIHRWLKLYGELPEAASWVWKHYPQGEFWLEQIQMHGSEVLEKALPLGRQTAAEISL